MPETTPCVIRDKLAEYGAEVRVHGKVNQLAVLSRSYSYSYNFTQSKNILELGTQEALPIYVLPSSKDDVMQ